MQYHKCIYDNKGRLICYWNLEETRYVPLNGSYASETSKKDIAGCDVVFFFDKYERRCELELKTKFCPPIFGSFARFETLNCDPHQIFKLMHCDDFATRSKLSFFTTSHDREMMLNFLLTIANFDKENVSNQKLEQFVSNFL